MPVLGIVEDQAIRFLGNIINTQTQILYSAQNNDQRLLQRDFTIRHF